MYSGRLERLGAKLDARAEDSQAKPMMMSASDASKIVELCALAIDRGAPLFNHGQHEACASVYEIAIASIDMLREEQLDEHTRTMVKRSLRDGRRVHDAGDRAWHYRATLDALIERFSEHG